MELHNSPTEEPWVPITRVSCCGGVIELPGCGADFVELPAAWKEAMDKIQKLNSKREAAMNQNESVQQYVRFLGPYVEGIKNDENSSLMEVLGRVLLMKWHMGNIQFFKDLAKAAELAKRGFNAQCHPLLLGLENALIVAAVNCYIEHQRNPSREEVIQKSSLYRIPKYRGDWGKLFRRCGLGFLRGKPRGKAAKRKTGHIAL